MPRCHIAASNLDLHYDIHGVGPNKVLFIMGLVTDGGAWALQTDYFLVHHPEYQCVTYDHRGIGKSSLGNAWRHTTTLLAQDALELVNHLGWERFHVVGISMGGMIAVELSVEHPERILSLSLIATHAGGPTAIAPISGVIGLFKSMLSKTDQERVQHGIALLYGKKTLANPEKRAHLIEYHSKRLQTREKPALWGIIAQLMAVPSHYVSYSRLLRIRYCPFPTLVLVGTEDALVREENSSLIARTICATKFVVIQGAGHAPVAEDADIVNEELLAIFKRGEELKHLSKPDQVKYRRHLACLDLCCKHKNSCFLHIAGNTIKGASFGFLLSLIYRLLYNNAYLHNDTPVNPTWKLMMIFGLLRCGITSFTCFRRSLLAYRAFRKLGAKPPRGHDHILDEREIISSQHYWFPISPFFYFLATLALVLKYKTALLA